MSVMGMHILYLVIGLIVGGSIASFIMLYILEQNARMYNKSIDHTNREWQGAAEQRIQEWKTHCNDLDRDWETRAHEMVAEAIIKRDKQWRREEGLTKKKVIN